MCGICGIVGRPDRAALRRMAAAMAHRGPDDDGFYLDDVAGLGFRRLSIIDVTGGRQPLANEDDSLHLVFNGEIYNHQLLRARLESRGHRFRTHSDGEVILHLYEEKGAALVDDLNGIFAFALWNPADDELVLARDHHGVKPLYYAERDGEVIFASEIKSVLASLRVSRERRPRSRRAVSRLPGRPSAALDPPRRPAAAARPRARAPAGRDARADVLDAAARGRAAGRIRRRGVRDRARRAARRRPPPDDVRAPARGLPVGRRRLERARRARLGVRQPSAQDLFGRLRGSRRSSCSANGRGRASSRSGTAPTTRNSS